VPFDQAVLNAANTLFTTARVAPGTRHLLLIDPLVDGQSGAQSIATRTIQSRLEELVRSRYPQYDVQPFTAANLSRGPLVLVGTFTAVNRQGQTAGTREAYRFCLVLADVRSGKTVGKGVARAAMDGVDATPTAFFSDSPAWRMDANVAGYIRTCQGTQPGDNIDPVYLDGLLASALIADAIEAYNERRYRAALDLYASASRTNAGDQLRVHNGVYLTHAKLGQHDLAAEAFGRIIDYGLKHDRLAVKFLFRPGSTAFVADRDVSGPYDMWLRQIARRASQAQSCLEVTGHTSPTGPAALNERLSLLRAEFVKARLEGEAATLKSRTIANGVGSREVLIGTGADNATDALDRRVEFKRIGC
jgi:outer membrane protein OmpA-like peptidoglycan-associated protein